MMPNNGRDLDGSHGGAYQPLPFSIWGSFWHPRLGSSTQMPKLELLSLRGHRWSTSN